MTLYRAVHPVGVVPAVVGEANVPASVTSGSALGPVPPPPTALSPGRHDTEKSLTPTGAETDDVRVTTFVAPAAPGEPGVPAAPGAPGAPAAPVAPVAPVSASRSLRRADGDERQPPRRVDTNLRVTTPRAAEVVERLESIRRASSGSGSAGAPPFVPREPRPAADVDQDRRREPPAMAIGPREDRGEVRDRPDDGAFVIRPRISAKLASELAESPSG